MMLRLLVWRCNRCGADYEVFYDSQEFKTLMEEDVPQLCLCGGELIPFNLKNNSQRWKFADAE